MRQPDAETMALLAGELVLIPHGGEHEVEHSPRGKAMKLETFLATRDRVVDQSPRAVRKVGAPCTGSLISGERKTIERHQRGRGL